MSPWKSTLASATNSPLGVAELSVSTKHPGSGCVAANCDTSPTLDAAESHAWAASLIGQWAAAARLETPVDALITAAKDRIAACLISGISVDALAAELHVSSAHLSRRFRAATGQTLRDWIRQERMRLARDMLTDPNRTVTEVAHYLGYPTAGHLSRSYRQVYNTTPQADRTS